MSGRLAWPALHLEREQLPHSLVFERGVWGKVHGAPTDYRWIARSAAFGAGDRDLETELNLGGEDVPAAFQAWRNAGDRCYAIHAYPSRATDAAGRRGFLEKQVLEWRVPAGVPAALGAILLLPLVAGMSDTIWWNRYSVERWTDPELVLPIAASEHEAIPVEEDSIDRAIQQGCDALRAAVAPLALEQLYEQLLSGQKPASLPGLRQPLPPAALAALLLPLSRNLADRLSLAGWIPSSRPVMKDLADRWDVIVVQAASGRAETPPSPRAREMADTLLGRVLLFDDMSRVEEIGELEEPPDVPEILTIGDIVDEKTKASPAAIARVPVRSTTARFAPGLRLDLTPPAGDSPRIVMELYEFAVAADRRWPDLDAWKRAGEARAFHPEDAEARLLCGWVQQVRQQHPPHAHQEQWEVKVDLLRSAAIVLVPKPSTIDQVGLPGNDSRVPALLFGWICDSRRQREPLEGLGEKRLSEILEQSLRCRGSSFWAQRLRDWLRRWQGDGDWEGVNVRRLIGQALERFPG